MNVPPSSARSILVFKANGTGTLSFPPVGLAPTTDVGGTYRYSNRTKRPSGGTKDSSLLLAKRCNLSSLVSRGS